MDLSTVDTVIGVSVGTLIMLCIWLLCMLMMYLRPYLPVKVNCWFCMAGTIVSYRKRNSWDCRNCTQYNGFDESGGYNKAIPEQSLNLNPSRYCISDASPSNKKSLCKSCCRWQEYKIKTLASFEPSHPDLYDKEIEIFRKLLENNCQLCKSCQELVAKVVNDNLVESLNREQLDFMRIYRKTKQPPQNNVFGWLSACHLISSVVALGLSCAIWFRVNDADDHVSTIRKIVTMIVHTLQTLLMYKVLITSSIITLLLAMYMSQTKKSVVDGCLGMLWILILVLSFDIPESLAVCKVADIELPFLLVAAIFHIVAGCAKKNSDFLKNIQLIKLSNNLPSSLLLKAQYPSLAAKTVEIPARQETNGKMKQKPEHLSESWQVIQACQAESVCSTGNVRKTESLNLIKESVHAANFTHPTETTRAVKSTRPPQTIRSMDDTFPPKDVLNTSNRSNTSIVYGEIAKLRLENDREEKIHHRNVTKSHSMSVPINRKSHSMSVPINEPFRFHQERKPVFGVVNFPFQQAVLKDDINPYPQRNSNFSFNSRKRTGWQFGNN